MRVNRAVATTDTNILYDSQAHSVCDPPVRSHS